MILIVDMNQEESSLSYSEFILPIIRILHEVGIPHQVVHFHNLTPAMLDDTDGLILSGTPLMDNAYYDHLEEFTWLKDQSVPLLGICAGMQFLALLHGSEITPCLEIGMISIRVEQPNPIPLLFPVEEFEAYDLHRNAIIPSDDLEIIARSDNAIQAFRVKGTDMFGVLFHPEVRNPEIIERFVKEYC